MEGRAARRGRDPVPFSGLSRALSNLPQRLSRPLPSDTVAFDAAATCVWFKFIHSWPAEAGWPPILAVPGRQLQDLLGFPHSRHASCTRVSSVCVWGGPCRGSGVREALGVPTADWRFAAGFS